MPVDAKLYLVRVITYGVTHPIKIGVTRDLAQRMRNLPSMGIHCSELIGYFEMPVRSAYAIEAAACRHFPRCPRYGERSREILDASTTDLLQFVERRAPDSRFVVPQ